LKQWFFTVNHWVLLQQFELWFEPVSVYRKRVVIGPTIRSIAKELEEEFVAEFWS